MARELGVVRIYPPEDTPATLVTLAECAKNLIDHIEKTAGTVSMKGENVSIRQFADRIAAYYNVPVEVKSKD